MTVMKWNLLYMFCLLDPFSWYTTKFCKWGSFEPLFFWNDVKPCLLVIISTKVLWRDSKDGSSGLIVDTSCASPMSRISPEGHQIPLEWDDLPVDTKYIQPYVTPALLKQEQESLTSELKRLPDVAKVGRWVAAVHFLGLHLNFNNTIW